MADDTRSGGDAEFDAEFAAEKPIAPAPAEAPAEGDAPPASDKKEGEELEEEPDDVVVPIRKSTAQHIISRQKNTIEKLRSKDDEGDDEPPAPHLDDDEEDDAPQLPKGKSAVAREVAAQMKPIINTFISSTDEAELKDLFSSEPESKRYEKRIRAYMEHPQWKAIPPSAIYHHLAFEAAAGVKQKEKKKEAADKEADLARGAGSQRREIAPASNIPSETDLDDMDDAQFENLQNEVRSGKFIKK